MGVFGGSFDPPHYGHLALAETARVQLRLNQVLFVPAGEPPHKQAQALSAAKHRVAMVAAAIADHPDFILSRVDVDRDGPHYTADTLALLRGQHPSVAAWYFLMGEDALHDLPQWHNPEAILQRATLVVMPRERQPADREDLIEALPSLTRRLVWLDVLRLHISASELRRRVRRGLPLRYLVPPPVEAYIQKHGLYG